MSKLPYPGGTTVQEIHPSTYLVSAEQLVPRLETGSARDGWHLCTRAEGIVLEGLSPSTDGSCLGIDLRALTLLTNQFISGLQPELKSKLAGQEGSFDQLLAKAHFEEAKQREFAAERKPRSSSKSHGGVAPRTPSNNYTQAHRTRAIGGTNLRETHQQEAHCHQPPRETRAKYGVARVEQWGMCIGTALTVY